MSKIKEILNKHTCQEGIEWKDEYCGNHIETHPSKYVTVIKDFDKLEKELQELMSDKYNRGLAEGEGKL